MTMKGGDDLVISLGLEVKLIPGFIFVYFYRNVVKKLSTKV